MAAASTRLRRLARSIPAARKAWIAASMSVGAPDLRAFRKSSSAAACGGPATSGARAGSRRMASASSAEPSKAASSKFTRLAWK